MPSGVSKAKVIGSFLFLSGVVVLALAITGLMPREDALLDDALISQLIVSVGMLIVSTFMVSSGMFFIIYGAGGDRHTVEDQEVAGRK